MAGAKLPGNRVEYTIAELPVDEKGFAQSSALIVKADLSCFLRGSEFLRPTNVIGHEMMVLHHQDGYKVTLAPNSSYQPSDQLPDWVKDEELIPVIEVLDLQRGG